MVCDRVAILVEGSVASQGTITHLTKDQERYEIEVQPPRTEHSSPNSGGPPAPIVSPFDRLPTGEPITVAASTITVGTVDAGRIQPLVDELRRRGIIIRSMKPVRPSLEDLFMQAVSNRPRADAGNTSTR